jgi:hypothetical protein
MRVCIVNQSDLPDLEVLKAIRVINAQLVDFAYHWGTIGQLRLEGSRGKTMSMKELRGDAIIYIGNEAEEGALGWHDADKYGVPYGVVYTKGYDEPWTVTFSHEVLELLLDPHVNLLCAGPHPTEDRDVLHWREASDAVQADFYYIGDTPVSDFLLPAYFTPGEEKGMRMSYLGADIKSFGIAPGGYVGFYDPMTGEHDVSFADAVGKARYEKKGKRGRGARYLSIGGRGN